ARPNRRGAVVKARTGTVRHGFAALDLRQAIDASRRRLGLDQLDGLLLHSPWIETLHKPEIREFLGDLLRGGKAARVGASVDSLDALEVAVSVPGVALSQAPLERSHALLRAAVLE